MRLGRYGGWSLLVLAIDEVLERGASFFLLEGIKICNTRVREVTCVKEWLA